MAKYIDPAILSKELERRRLSTGRLVQWQAAMEAATVEVPENVRCRECVHFSPDDDGHVVVYRCELNVCDMRDDFYCADGERREDSGEGNHEP